MSVADAMIQNVLLGDAVANADVAVFVVDDSGRYAAVNDAACRLTGYPREELLRLSLTDLAVAPARALRTLEAAVQRKQTQGRAELRHKNGTPLEVRWHLAHTSVGGVDYMLSYCSPEPTAA
ncbi:MAG TPA: PAS domain-containing protein [Gaiellaceae bacterium]|nr:PAS domain-containing protein [Gaiellaceae bacterium]